MSQFFKQKLQQAASCARSAKRQEWEGACMEAARKGFSRAVINVHEDHEREFRAWVKKVELKSGPMSHGCREFWVSWS